MSGLKEADQNCGIPNQCARVVPGWKIAVDNLPVGVMFVIGTAILWPITGVGAAAYFIYCCASIVLFWALICPYCHHYDTRACPCGYGMMSPKFFKARPGREFKKVFKQNIAIMYPCWIFPFFGGAYRLWSDFSRPLLVLFVSFCVIGFVLIPLISKVVGCSKCEMKADCPWMS